MHKPLLAVLATAATAGLAACGGSAVSAPTTTPVPPATTSTSTSTSPSPIATPSSTATSPTHASTSAAPAASPSSYGRPTEWVVSTDGYGPIRIGMTVAQLRAVIGPTFRLDANSGNAPACEFATAGALPPSVVFFITDGRLVATDVGGFGSQADPPRTPAGLTLGQSEATVRRELGPKATAQQPTSTSGTEYLLTTSSGGKVDVLVQDDAVFSFSEGSAFTGTDGCV